MGVAGDWEGAPGDVQLLPGIPPPLVSSPFRFGL